MKVYAKNFCDRHPGVELVDLVEGVDGGGLEARRVCPRCVPVELVDVVRQLHRRKESP